MMISKICLSLFLCTFLFLSGCAGSFRVSLKDCPKSNVQFAQISEKNENSFYADHSFVTKVWSYGISTDSPTEVELKDILEDNGFSCLNIKYMRYTLGQSLWDQVFSIVPLIQRSSIKIELALSSDNLDDKIQKEL